ncbi:MAG: pyridoxal phosphate-dependent aminotransferase [Candidatus Cloacimonetes bacterium]|nr:pyridoxal phosphate-dependent aminotransferase [Candidatus Cloacimonadota bacterium]
MKIHDYLSDSVNRLTESGIRKVLQNAPPNSINLALGEIPRPLSPLIKNYLNEIIQNEIHNYTQNQGIEELRNLISDCYYDNFSPDEICITVGAEEAIFTVLNSFLNQGDLLLIPDPIFPAYKTIAEFTGAKVVTFALDCTKNFAVNRKQLESVIGKMKIKALLLCNPSNPTSHSLSTEDQEYIVKICREKKILLIVDEIYLSLSFFPIRSFSELGKDIVIISGLSKSFSLTGWRIGWFAAPSEVINKLTRLHQFTVTCAPYISQRLAIKLLQSKKLVDDYFLKNNLNRNQKHSIEFLSGELKYQIPTPDAAPYLFVEIPYDDLNFVQRCKSNGVLVVPGSVFGEMGKNHIRINYGVDFKLLEQGLKRIGEVINSY